MSFFELVKTALKNLRQRKARTMLTVLGVIIGTMSITLMIAVGIGSQQTFIEQISQNEDLTRMTIYGGYYGVKGNDATKLDDKAVLGFEGINNVKTVLPVKNITLYLKNSKYISEIYALAAPVDKLAALLGDELDWGDIQQSSEVKILLGKDISEYNFYLKKAGKEMWQMPLATDIDFETETFEVYFGGQYLYSGEEGVVPTGVSLPRKKTGCISGIFTQTGGERDYQAYIDISFVNQLVKGNKKFAELIGITDAYATVYVYADDMDNVATIMQTIKDQGFEVYSPLEYIQQMQKESARQQAVWGAVGAIALLVSAIGIINTMLTSILERRKEIGVLKVLGCSLGKINLMFLVEAGVIGLFGGAAGVALSYLFSIVVKIDAGLFGEGVRFIITPMLALFSAIGGAIVGMIAGIYPAARAMRMSPLSALRNE